MLHTKRIPPPEGGRTFRIFVDWKEVTLVNVGRVLHDEALLFDWADRHGLVSADAGLAAAIDASHVCLNDEVGVEKMAVVVLGTPQSCRTERVPSAWWAGRSNGHNLLSPERFRNGWGTDYWFAFANQPIRARLSQGYRSFVFRIQGALYGLRSMFA